MALATIADYYNAIGKPLPALTAVEQARLAALLEDASDDVVHLSRTARYTTDRDGVAESAAVRTALMRATCHQASYYETNPRARSEETREFDTIRAGSFTLSSNAGSSSAGNGGRPVAKYSSKAITILRNAGLYAVTARSGY